MNDALLWIENIIKAHEVLTHFQKYSDEINCYTIINKCIPINNLAKLAHEAGLDTRMESFGKPGEYPEYEGKLVCHVYGWELYELISKGVVNE